MKKLFFIFLFIFSYTFMNAQITHIYIVRHAEKDLSDKENPNPDLSDEGKQRAERLLTELKKVKFSAAYSTPYKRTQQTLQPVAEYNKIGTMNYDPRNNQKLVEEILSTHSNETVIIAGHSNTIPGLLEAFGAKVPFETIPEEDYSNIFHLTIDKDKVNLDHSNY